MHISHENYVTCDLWHVHVLDHMLIFYTFGSFTIDWSHQPVLNDPLVSGSATKWTKEWGLESWLHSTSREYDSIADSQPVLKVICVIVIPYHYNRIHFFTTYHIFMDGSLTKPFITRLRALYLTYWLCRVVLLKQNSLIEIYHFWEQVGFSIHENMFTWISSVFAATEYFYLYGLQLQQTKQPASIRSEQRFPRLFLCLQPYLKMCQL